MKELSKEYLLLFNTITDLDAELMQLHDRLIRVQQRAEELYVSCADEPMD